MESTAVASTLASPLDCFLSSIAPNMASVILVNSLKYDGVISDFIRRW